VAGIAVLPLLLLLFPDGRPPSRRWRFLTWTVVATGTVLIIIGPLLPGRSGFVAGQKPLGAGGVIGEVVTILAEVGVWAIGAAIILSALSLVFRYRRATRIERQQIKWFHFAAVVLIGYFLLADYLPEPWNSLLITVALTGLYVAVGVAILRYRLYNIDRIINRTLVYGSLTVSLAAVYFGGVATTQTLFRALTGQEHQPQLAIVVSTLVISALFMPLRRRIQAFIDKRFYRRKYDARKTLEAFSAKLREELDLDALNAGLVGVVTETMQPAHVSLWLRPNSPRKGEQAD
jgi:MFS family permease